jgi:hypothetical protein
LKVCWYLVGMRFMSITEQGWCRSKAAPRLISDQ